MGIIDISGKRFHRLTVNGFSHYGKRGQAIWHCVCDCGKEKCLERSAIGRTKSCGCATREAVLKRCLAHGHSRRGKMSPTYLAYHAMMQRCFCRSQISYSNYGGRGITVCERWQESFTNFLADMGEHPGKGYSLDRIDNDGNYEPGNCRWATRKQQQRNKRSNRRLLLGGRSLCLTEVSEEAGRDESCIRQRLNKGESPEEAISNERYRLSRPRALDEDKVRAIRMLMAIGWSNKEIAREYHVEPPTIYGIRVGKHWSHVTL